MTVIQVENISKVYKLGSINTGTLSHDLNKWFARLLGKEDPFQKLGNNSKKNQSKNDLFWALKNVSFDLQQGDTLGIIGKNGAGKSTLLKILSRITAPTEGAIKIK